MKPGFLDAQLRKKQRRGKRNKKPLVFTLDFFVLIASQRARDQKGKLFCGRNIKFTAQQGGLDFALVQARHSSKVISYFATKALSTSLLPKRPALEKQSAAGLWPSTISICSHLASLVDIYLFFLAKCL